MDKISSLIWLLILISILILIGTIVMGVIMKVEATSLCKKECFSNNGLAFEVYESGNWKVDDICVCFYEDRVKTFRLGGQ